MVALKLVSAIILTKIATGSYLVCMRAVGIKILKDRLSEYVRLAASGEVVLVTDRDRVVAELGPPGPGRAELVTDARLADAVRKGWLTPPLGMTGPVPGGHGVAPLADLLVELAADRDAR
jgi:antitoxin (DNA-binding transcriptional repressor) of toxin-antitoxin stability system